MTTRSDPPAPAAMLRPPRHRRVQLAWAALVLAALATTLAVYWLYASIQRELRTQSIAVSRQKHDEVAAHIARETHALRMTTMRSLIAFHAEGLGYHLRNWDEATPAIIGTFEWDAASGFLPESVFPPSAAAHRDEIPALWRELRAWRATHPEGKSTIFRPVGSYSAGEYSVADAALFPAAELGYHGENIDMLRYAGRAVDPWAGWAARNTTPGEVFPWVIWYQAGPGAPVRGCFVDLAPLVAGFRREMERSRVTRVELVPIVVEGGTRDLPIINEGLTWGAGPGAGEGVAVELEALLPGFALAVDAGEVFARKQFEARLMAFAIVLLLAIFLLGAFLLALYSGREMREAEMKTTFVAQVSHELRTPLTSIRMFADMLTGPELAEEKRTRFARTISRESTRLGALIERLLLFNALEHGGPNGEVTTVDVGAVVRETLDEMEASLAAGGMQVESDLSMEPQFALTERSALKQALLNLLENALKYARDGRVIRVQLARVADEVRVTVADAGPGVPRELGARAFEPFVQGGRSLTDKSPGVGLGLSIARGWLRRVRGDLVLLPSEKGAHFEIRLPATSSA